MKALYLPILLLLSIISINAQTYTINQNQPIILTDGYVNNMSVTWNVESTVTDRPLIINYTIRTERNFDFVAIYNVDNAGNITQLIRMSGSETGQISTLLPNGKARITFRTNANVCFANNPAVYSGLNISFAVDNSTIATTTNSYQKGNAIIDGMVGINITPSQAFSVKGRIAVATDGIISDEGYNGALMITRKQVSGQYINLIRDRMYPWSIGTVYNTNKFAIGTGKMNDALFTDPLFSIDPHSRSVGINTPNPLYTLDVNGKLYLRTVESIGGWGHSYLHWNTHSLVMGTPIGHYAYNSVDFKPGGVNEAPLFSQLRMYTAKNENEHDLKIQFNTMGNSFINSDGNVGIKTSNPQYTLDVKGTIRATEVKIESIDNFPDYVFSENYSLRPLSEVNNFIRENGHLPEIPSAQEVKENGISLVEMNKILLKKVEELTLYVIELNRKYEELSTK